jgi:hypothetical protein
MDINRSDTAGVQREQRPPAYRQGYREHPAVAALRRSLEKHNKKPKRP